MNPNIAYFMDEKGQLVKALNSPDYKYLFNTNTGYFMRWGKTQSDDPQFSPFGPELLDIEVSTSCHGGCTFCYKSNTPNGHNMSFDTFKSILDKVPETLTQIAFGIGDIDANPDLWKMMKYARGRMVASNMTINGQRMTPQYYDLIASNCGATAVSLYDPDTCYNAVKELSDRGLRQTNIHCLLSEENYDKCKQALVDMKTDPRLENLNALVFLWLKPRGERNTCHQLSSLDKLKSLVDYAFDNELRIGFDSCSSPYFLKTIKDRDNYKRIETLVEPCESTLFSYYINVDGTGYPCSFNETPGNGTDTVNCEDFMKDVWMAPETIKFRERLLARKRACPTYHLDPVPV